MTTTMSHPFVIDNSNPRYIVWNGVRYRRLWTHPVTAESLPGELLEKILKHLDWTDLKSAMQVNKFWADTVLGYQRWWDGKPLTSHLHLTVMPCAEENGSDYQHYRLEDYHQILMKSHRRYKQITIYWGSWDRCQKTNQVKDQMVLDIIKRFKERLISLKIISGKYDMPPWTMSDILRTCIYLKHLDINGMQVAPEAKNYQYCNTDTFRTGVKSLYDSNQIFSPNPLASNLFANLTTLQVKITPAKKHKNLFRKISPQLVELILSWELDMNSQVPFPSDEFPLLETLTLESARTGPDTKLGQFLQRMPKLRQLVLSPHQDEHVSVLSWINSENLHHLEVTPYSLCPKKFALIAKFPNLETICIRGAHAMPNGPKKEGIVFDKTKRLALYGHEWRPHLTNFLTFFPNLVELELEAKACWSPADARCISNFASLQRLIINEGLGTLESFMEFCGGLKVPELTINTQNNAFIVKAKSKPYTKAPHIRKLSFNAYMIEPSIYKPMMSAMPNLRRLELTLQIPCVNEIYRRICAKFPLCVTVRKNYEKYESVFDNT